MVGQVPRRAEDALDLGHGLLGGEADVALHVLEPGRRGHLNLAADEFEVVGGVGGFEKRGQLVQVRQLGFRWRSQREAVGAGLVAGCRAGCAGRRGSCSCHYSWRGGVPGALAGRRRRLAAYGGVEGVWSGRHACRRSWVPGSVAR